jgi:uncharacterized RDD family membrane protein YckC
MARRAMSARWRPDYPLASAREAQQGTLSGISAIALASRPTRLFAYLTDMLLLLLVLFVPVVLLATRGVMLPNDIISPFVYVIWPAYFILSESKLMGGQTLGKRLMSIAVVRQSGGYLSLPRAILRTLPLVFLWDSSIIARGLPAELMSNPSASMIYHLATLSVCIGVYLLPWVLPNRRGLRDLLAGSIVIIKDPEPV